MSRELLTAVIVVIVGVIFAAMAWAWRTRAHRDAAYASHDDQPLLKLIRDFDSLMYVSSTPAGEPLQRLSLPGLRYRGPAQLSIYEDGITIAVRAEQPVHIAATRVTGSAVARVRIGKAVEQDGLTLIQWRIKDLEIESTFRAPSREVQQSIRKAIDTMLKSQHSTEA